MMLGQSNDLYWNYRFLVEMGGIVQAGFSEIVMPDASEHGILDLGRRRYSRFGTCHGGTRYGNIILKWGTTFSMELCNWRKRVEQGNRNDIRRNLVLLVIDEEGNVNSRWQFSNAWPISCDAPDFDTIDSFNAVGSCMSVESLEIAHDGMQRAQW